MVIGILAGVVCFSATMLIKRKLKIDDSLDVFPVHAVGGALGTLLCGIFSSTSLGLFSGYDFNTDMGLMTMGDQLGVQFIGVIATVAFTATMTFVILKLVGLMTGDLRVEQDQEIEGLDLVLHEERGYDIR